jgi:hypothetical protein
MRRMSQPRRIVEMVAVVSVRPCNCAVVVIVKGELEDDECRI